MYLMFPIGIMYYFGTNLDDRFSVPGFWPTAENSHRLPRDREELEAEYEKMVVRQKLKMAKKAEEDRHRIQVQAQAPPQSNERES